MDLRRLPVKLVGVYQFTGNPQKRTVFGRFGRVGRRSSSSLVLSCHTELEVLILFQWWDLEFCVLVLVLWNGVPLNISNPSHFQDIVGDRRSTILGWRAPAQRSSFLCHLQNITATCCELKVLKAMPGFTQCNKVTKTISLTSSIIGGSGLPGTLKGSLALKAQVSEGFPTPASFSAQTLSSTSSSSLRSSISRAHFFWAFLFSFTHLLPDLLST